VTVSTDEQWQAAMESLPSMVARGSAYPTKYFRMVMGLRNKKHKFISDLMKENKLNFIAISETKRSELMSRFLKSLCGGRDYL
jgi:predicted DNA binding protein